MQGQPSMWLATSSRYIPPSLFCICIPLLGCIDPPIRTSVKDISPLGSATVTMAFAAKISCDGSCKHKHHHLVESLMHHKLKVICKQKPSSAVRHCWHLIRGRKWTKSLAPKINSVWFFLVNWAEAALRVHAFRASHAFPHSPSAKDWYGGQLDLTNSQIVLKQAACCRGWVGVGCLCASADCFKLASAGCQGLSRSPKLGQTG